MSAVCSTGDIWFYHKNAIVVPMRTLKFGSFTDSIQLFFSKKNLNSCLNAERADLLALVCGVFCEFVTFPLVSWVRCGT